MQIQQNAFHAKGNIIMLCFNCRNPHGKLLYQSKFSSLKGREYQCVSFILKGIFNFLKNNTKNVMRLYLELHALQFLYMYISGFSC